MLRYFKLCSTDLGQLL